MVEKDLSKIKAGLTEKGVTNVVVHQDKLVSLKEYKLSKLGTLEHTEGKSEAVTGMVEIASCHAFTFEGAYEALRRSVVNNMLEITGKNPETRIHISEMVNSSDSNLKYIIAYATVPKVGKVVQEYCMADADMHSKLMANTATYQL